MLPIFRPCCFANASSWGRRAIVPSSLRISTITAAGSSPARRARSQPASVWPARVSTPPGLRHQREHVAGLAQVFRPRLRRDRDADGARAVVGGDAGGHALRPPRWTP